jgi:hypothetical protein
MPETTVEPVVNLKEYFKDALHAALVKQRLSVEGETEHYVVNLLTLFARSEALFDATPEGPRLKPLVVLLTEAMEARTREERNRGLQRLGDVSLFIAGFFAQGFARKLIDIDYHIAMGGRAYGTLAEALSGGVCAPRRSRALALVFTELAEKFQMMVDALNELSESAYTHSDRDILRLYELWLRTGSRRSFRLLRRLGIEPVAHGTSAAGPEMGLRPH